MPYYNAGAVGGDAFPDVVMGQFAIHPVDHATWLIRVLDMAWAAQEDPWFSGEEKSQILAWSYGLLTHSAGDHWAHTLVNEFAEGVAPGFFAAGESVPTADISAAGFKSEPVGDQWEVAVGPGWVERRNRKQSRKNRREQFHISVSRFTVLSIEQFSLQSKVAGRHGRGRNV